MKRNRKNSVRPEVRAIMESIEKIKTELENARMNFDMATDESLIDCYIYEISSFKQQVSVLSEESQKVWFDSGRI